jgi:polyhydroxyalkanoate synthase subunit PhaE
MTVTPWEEFARRSREMFEWQAELTRSWFEGTGKITADFVSAMPNQGGGESMAAMAELWRSWLALNASWSGMMPGKSDPGHTADETLQRFINPMSQALMGGSQIGETIRRMTEGPRFADLGTIERRMARIMGLWFQAQKATGAYEAVIATAWTQAYRRFLDELRARHDAREMVLKPRDILKLWLDIANQTLLETHRSAKFLEAQAAMLRQGMDLVLAERQMIEFMVEPAGLPTRSEIDEVHHSVQDLKRRVRTLEKAPVKATRNSVEPTVARLPGPGPKVREHLKVSEQGAQP